MKELKDQLDSESDEAILPLIKQTQSNLNSLKDGNMERLAKLEAFIDELGQRVQSAEKKHEKVRDVLSKIAKEVDRRHELSAKINDLHD